MPYRTPSDPRRGRRLPLLERVAVKTSCTASWDDMVGDETTRFCCTCSKNVYDLTAMIPDEADAFLAQHLAATGALPCARIYQRPDGRVLTSECPSGAARRHVSRVATTLAVGAAGVALLAGGVDLATRPTLAPDVADALREEHDVGSQKKISFTTSLGELSLREEKEYDVNAALRSDEPDEIAPEGEGPARRRYVRASPESRVIHGTTTLVVDTTGIIARRRGSL